MSRHQRTSNTPIVTRARAAESSFQLELPGEAGLLPPQREAEEPSTWIIEDEVHRTASPYDVTAGAGFRPRPRPPQGEEVPPPPPGAATQVLGEEGIAGNTIAPGAPTVPIGEAPAATKPATTPASPQAGAAGQSAGPQQAAAAPPGAAPKSATPASPQAAAAPQGAVPPPAAKGASPAPPERPVAAPLAAMAAEPKPIMAPETNRLDQPPADVTSGPRPASAHAEPVEAPPPAPAPPLQFMYSGPPIDERILAEATSKSASILAEAERERQQLLEKTRAEAGKIVESARAEREQALVQAKKEAEAIKEEARKIREGAHAEGHAAGLEAGHADAKAAAYAAMEERVGDLIAAIHRITQDALDERHKSLDVLEPEVVGLALEIAEKLITRELTLNPDAVAAVARDCIGRVRDRQEIVIHGHAADIETLQRYRDQFIRLEDLGSLRIVEDSRLSMRGGILLENSGGEIDARMETQLERIRQEFDRVREAENAD